ncbi:nitroreductase family protein [Thermodesulfobacteriota bacterium]
MDEREKALQRMNEHVIDKRTDKRRKEYLPPELDSEEIFRLMRHRRSIRHYEPNPVPPDLINKIIDAARWAPSACNRQPVRFVIVEDREDIDFLYNIRREKWMRKAPLVIIVGVDIITYSAAEKQYTPYMDVGAAIQNMLLMAHALDLGACWINYGEQECGIEGLRQTQKRFQLDPGIQTLSLVAIGYPAINPRDIPRIPIEELILGDQKSKENTKR